LTGGMAKVELDRKAAGQRQAVNGDAAESFRVNLWLKWSLFFSINESVSYLYRSAAEPAMCNHHLGLLFHMR